jgi:hypothetical protein
MAPRKPNKSRRDKPNDSLANQVGGWLGGAAKGVYNYSESQARTFTNPYINAAGRAIGKNPNLPVSGAKEAITNTAWGVVDVASGPIGRAAGKGVTAAGRAVAKTGVPARIVNKVTGQKVVVHASPQTGLNRIDPRLGSNQLPDKNVVFGWDPKKSGMQDQITRLAGRYVSKKEGQSAGSIYVTSIRKSEIVTPQNLSNTGQVVSRGSGRVVSEIPVSGKTTAQVNAELQRQLRLAGARSKPTVSRTAAAAERAKSKVGQTFMTKAQKDAARRKRIR